MNRYECSAHNLTIINPMPDFISKSKAKRLIGRATLGCRVRCGVFALICFAYSGGAAVLAGNT